MPTKIISQKTAPANPRPAELPKSLHQQIDACLWLEETATDPVVRAFARIARRRLEDQVPV